MSRLPWMSVLLVIAAAWPPRLDAQQRDVALVGVTIVDPATSTRLERGTVLIRGDRIAAVGRSAEVAIPAGATRIDGAGRFVMPGLIDAHVHLAMAGRGALGALLHQGVTTVRDMGGDLGVLAWRDSIASGRLVGPTVRAAATIVESKRWVNAVLSLPGMADDTATVRELRERFAVETVAEVTQVVDSLARLKADFVKVRNFPPADATFALLRAARARGLRVVGHAPPMGFVATVADSGYHTFEHPVLTSRDGRLTEALSTLSPEDRAGVFRRLSAAGSFWTPTLVAERARLLADSTIERMTRGPSEEGDAGLVTPELRERWNSALMMRRAAPDTTTDWSRIWLEASGRVVEALGLGVRLLTGSDLGVAGVVPGAAVHDELEFLTGAGLTPFEALRAATSDAAAALGLAGDRGTIGVGKVADLLLLEGDPSLDVRQTRRIAAVVARGRVYRGRDRERLLTH